MSDFLHNRYVRFIGFILLILAGLSILLGSLSDERAGTSAPRAIMDMGQQERLQGNESKVSQLSTNPDGYTNGLEDFEISSYQVRAQSSTFDPLCDAVENLKADTSIDFKNITRSLNYCRATFFVDNSQVAQVLNTLRAFDGVKVTRQTKSVTRRREQLQSYTSILRQQLASVERSLNIAETEFDEIAAFARKNNDAKTLAAAIREKLDLIETLTQKKISLTNNLDSQIQAAADLEERLNVVQFTVDITRSQPIQLNKTTRAWEQAWNELTEQFSNTLIAVTVFFGIFLLWSVRIVLYALVGIVLLRGIWKFVEFVWRK